MAEEISRLLQDRACPFNVSLLAHSMGNYRFKKMLMTSSERLSRNIVFDNVILKAADTNQENHAEWVGRILARFTGFFEKALNGEVGNRQVTFYIKGCKVKYNFGYRETMPDNMV